MWDCVYSYLCRIVLDLLRRAPFESVLFVAFVGLQHAVAEAANEALGEPGDGLMAVMRSGRLGDETMITW